MAYSFQTFGFNQVLTAAEMNQVEANVRDHAHGAAGVAPIASGWFAPGAVNATDIASGAVQAASIASGAVLPTTHLASGGIIRAALVTATAETAGTLGAGASVDIALNAYAFFPMIYTASTDVRLTGHSTDAGDPDSPRFRLVNLNGGSGFAYNVEHRYVQG
ncbi:MAG: hypothetical protein HY521_14955 [Proteobacteria bacterium]|nr:hypothetical protein [Pseudomonadota bacterium]